MKMNYTGSVYDCPCCGSDDTYTDNSKFPIGTEYDDEGVEITRHMYCGTCGKCYRVRYKSYEAEWDGSWRY